MSQNFRVGSYKQKLRTEMKILIYVYSKKSPMDQNNLNITFNGHKSTSGIDIMSEINFIEQICLK